MTWLKLDIQTNNISISISLGFQKFSENSLSACVISKKAISNEKKNEFCKVRQESKRNKRLFCVSTTRDIQ
jgi:hypothetical protein